MFCLILHTRKLLYYRAYCLFLKYWLITKERKFSKGYLAKDSEFTHQFLVSGGIRGWEGILEVTSVMWDAGIITFFFVIAINQLILSKKSTEILFLTMMLNI